MTIEKREPYSIDREQVAQMVAAHISGLKDAKPEASDYEHADNFIKTLDSEGEDSSAFELFKATSYLASMVFDGSTSCGDAIIVWLRSCNQDAKWHYSSIEFTSMSGNRVFLREGQELVRTIGNEFYIK